MNRKAQLVSFSLILIAFLLTLTVFALIPVFKETLDDSRGNSNLNCPGTPEFNVTQYDEDGDFNQLVRRPTCFTTGIYMVYFIMAFLIAVVSWVALNFRKGKR